MHQAESPADDARVPEELFDPSGSCVGDDVEVLGGLAHQEVAHRPPDDIGLVAGGLQALDDLDSLGGYG